MQAVSLSAGSVGNAKFRTSGIIPVTGLEADICVVKRFTRCAEGEEGFGIEVGEDEDENVEREVGERSHRGLKVSVCFRM